MSAHDEIAKVLMLLVGGAQTPFDDLSDRGKRVWRDKADALLASPVFARLIREAKAEGWDECSRLAAKTLGFPSSNPYRTDDTEENDDD